METLISFFSTDISIFFLVFPLVLIIFILIHILKNNTNTDLSNSTSETTELLKIKFLSVFTCLFILVTLAYTFYAYNSRNEVLTIPGALKKTPKEVFILNKNDEQFQKFLESSSLENQESFIADVERRLLDENLTEETKTELLLRKAFVLSFLRSLDIEIVNQNTQESTSILNSIIANQGTSPYDVYMRDYSLLTLIKLQKDCCFLKNVKNVTLENSIYNKYLESGYTEAPSKWLTLHDTLEKMSPVQQNDLASLSLSMAVTATILDSFKHKLKTETYEKLLKELGDDLQSFDKANTILYKDNSTKQLATIYYAYAYDIYTTSASTTKDTDTKIKLNYEASLLPQQDQDLNYHLNNFFAIINYLYSLNKSNNGMTDRATEDALIDKLMVSINFSKETKIQSELFLGSAFAGLGLLDPTKNKERYFMSLAKKNKKVAEYMQSLDVKIEDIRF